MIPFTLFMCFFSPVLPAFFVDPGWTCSLNIGPSEYRDQLSLQALKVNFKIVRKMKYPVTWDRTVKVWLDIILGCPIMPILFILPPRVSFTRSQRLIPATYNALFKPSYQPYFLFAFCFVSPFLSQGYVWDYGC